MKSIKGILTLWLTALLLILFVFGFRIVHENRLIDVYEQTVSDNEHLLCFSLRAKEITVLMEEYCVYQEEEAFVALDRQTGDFLADLGQYPPPQDSPDCLFFHRTLTNIAEKIHADISTPALLNDPFTRYYDAQVGLRTQGEFFVTQAEQFSFSMVIYNTAQYEKTLLANRKSAQLSNLFAILLLTVVGVSLLFTGKTMLHDIQGLSRQALHLFDKKSQAASADASRYAELSHVGQALDTMGSNILAYMRLQQEKISLENRYQQEKLQSVQKDRLLRRAQLQALQMQINPHFLFNTFNMISRSALLQDNTTTISLIEAISNIMRYSMEMGPSACLKDELAALCSYLDIQRIRFQDTIDFVLQNECEADFEEIRVPPLVIQPLVENAILHGVTDVPYRGRVDIRISCDAENLIIEVADNGKGIEAAQLAALQEQLRSHTVPEKTSIGLVNVASRLEHFFGRQNLFTISSEQGKGAKVRFFIPKGGAYAW